MARACVCLLTVLASAAASTGNQTVFRGGIDLVTFGFKYGIPLEADP